VTWIHFGANIGVADGKPSLRSASDDLRQLTEAELVRAGGRCVTLVRSNPLFHLPQERWPAHGRHGRRGPRCRSHNCFGVQVNKVMVGLRWVGRRRGSQNRARTGLPRRIERVLCLE